MVRTGQMVVNGHDLTCSTLQGLCYTHQTRDTPGRGLHHPPLRPDVRISDTDPSPDRDQGVREVVRGVVGTKLVVINDCDLRCWMLLQSHTHQTNC